MSKVFPKTITLQQQKLIEENNEAVRKQGNLIKYFLLSGILIYSLRILYLLTILLSVIRINSIDFNDRDLIIQRILLASYGIKTSINNLFIFLLFFVLIPFISKNLGNYSPVSYFFAVENKFMILVYILYIIITTMINFNIDKSSSNIKSVISSNIKYNYYEMSYKQLKYILYTKFLIVLIGIPIQVILIYQVVKNFMKVNINE